MDDRFVGQNAAEDVASEVRRHGRVSPYSLSRRVYTVKGDHRCCIADGEL